MCTKIVLFLNELMVLGPAIIFVLVCVFYRELLEPVVRRESVETMEREA